MNKQKSIYIKANKVANKRYVIKQRRRFLWFWEFWQKGSPTLGLGAYFSSRQAIKNAVHTKAAEKNLRPILIID